MPEKYLLVTALINHVYSAFRCTQTAFPILTPFIVPRTLRDTLGGNERANPATFGSNLLLTNMANYRPLAPLQSTLKLEGHQIFMSFDFHVTLP